MLRGSIAKARKIWGGTGRQWRRAGHERILACDQGKGTDQMSGGQSTGLQNRPGAGNPSGMSSMAGCWSRAGPARQSGKRRPAGWISRPAKGQPEAQYNLGYLYENGRGVPKDDDEAAAALNLPSRAASQNQRDALGAPGGIFIDWAKGVPKNISRAALLLYAAAMEGSRPGHCGT